MVLSAIGIGCHSCCNRGLLEGDASAFKVFTLLFNFLMVNLLVRAMLTFRAPLYGTRWSVCLLYFRFIWSRTKMRYRVVSWEPYATVAVTVLCGFFLSKASSQQYSSLRHCWCRRGDDFYFVPISQSTRTLGGFCRGRLRSYWPREFARGIRSGFGYHRCRTL